MTDPSEARVSEQPPAVRGGVGSRLLPMAVFLLVFAGHALYLRHVAAAPSDGWADAGLGDTALWGFRPYLAAQDYFVGFSYALGAAFAAWSLARFIGTRQRAMAAGAMGSVGLVGVLMAAGCFLLGCCGSPMLAVYLSLFGAKALGAGKPLMAGVTLLSLGCGYWCLSRRFAKGGCVDSCCDDPSCSPLSPLSKASKEKV